ncbi:MAG: sigma-70 family RNA polymerase sigma factor [Pirellulaceae bacterium]
MSDSPEKSQAIAQLSAREGRELLARNWMKAQPSILAFLLASTPQFSDAEDLLQEVAAEVAVRFDEYDPSRPFLPWALWVAKIKVADFYRSKKREKLVFAGEAIDALAESCTRLQVLISEEQQALDHCLRETTRRTQELLGMRYADDKKPREIASELGMSAAAVRVTLSRARSALMQCVAQRLERQSS